MKDKFHTSGDVNENPPAKRKHIIVQPTKKASSVENTAVAVVKNLSGEVTHIRAPQGVS